MRALVIGATGYVGSHIALALRDRGYEVSGLARTEANEQRLTERGFGAVSGSFDRLADIGRTAGAYDVVVMAAMVPFEQEREAMIALVEGCKQGVTRDLLFTSGTGVLSIEALDGRWSQHSFAEDDPFPFPARPNRAVRIQTEDLVRGASGDSLRTYVVRPPLIYGNGGSIQIPQIFESVRSTGSACYLGHGLNLYSAVHVEDLADVYCLAIERGSPGALYHAVSGEANFRTIAEAVAVVAGCDTKSLDYQAACDLWGAFWVDIALAVNSRSVARRTVDELGWEPRHIDVIEDIRSGSYAEKFHTGLSAYSWKSHG
ncbi:NAD-dependent epimerase/dehydratase family protein [Sphingobium sp. Sx8-8]|uniref:NAD-dependent epimerase/dehydratase family protein n=1 Tax=Sphingobium sp. Sx8-8 TaxID=2933617 RepID=UPI001F561B87|nr:NAD-dependent epimerase/dehydratase family protein [Sphingobium sp. Sx8-8]